MEALHFRDNSGFTVSLPGRLSSVDINNYRPKRSFGQGNIFTPVCHSVHRGVWSREGGLQFFGGVWSWGGLQFFRGEGLQFFGGLQFFFFFDFCFLWGYPPPLEYGQRSADTHPTGMHSCSMIQLLMQSF